MTTPKILPKVSVIIPVHNAVASLPQAIESVVEQTYAAFEIIIIDDGSTDNLAQRVRQIDAPQIRLVTQTHQGRSAALNHGLRLSQGEYLAFLNADDFWDSTKLEKQIAVFAQNPDLGIVDTWAFLVDDQQNVFSQTSASFAGNVWLEMLETNLIACGSSPMVRRHCFDRVGEFALDIQGFEDWHLWTRIAAHDAFDLVPEPLVYHRHSSSLNLDLTVAQLIKAVEDLYQSVPSDLLWKKRRFYSCTYLNIAASAYRSESYSEVIRCFVWALQSYPRFCLTKAQLSLLLKSLLCLGIGTQRSAQLKNITQILQDSPQG